MAGQSRTLKLSILGDIAQLTKSLTTGSNEVQGFGNKVADFGKKAGLAFAAAGAAAALYAGKFLVEATKNAAEDEKAQRNLALTLENTTGATRNQIAAVEDYITKTALAFGVTDDKLRPAFERLTRSTQDTQKSQELLNLAVSISAATSKPLETITAALAKAYDGNAASLGRLGLGVDSNILKSKDFDAITSALRENFAGFAEQEANTFEGKLRRLQIAFDEGKETVGSYVLDAITPLVTIIVNKVIPLVENLSSNLGKTLGPAFDSISKIIQNDLLPILTTWWKFLYEEIIPAIGSIVGPILAGLKSAFDKIKTALSDNSAELEPFYQALAKVWDFIKKYLAPLLGGTFKLALEAIGSIVAGLVNGFSKLVGFITSTVNKIKEFVNFVKDNPVTRFFFGDSNDKSLKVGTGFDAGSTMDTGAGGRVGGGVPGTGVPTFLGGNDPRTFTGAPLEAFSVGMQAAILRKNALVAETERLRQAREDRAANRAIATGGLTTAERVVINVNAASVIDEEGFSRAVTEALNNSTFRGTNGASNLVYL